MIRVLAMIAVAGFVLCVGSLAAAVAVGGPDAIARGGWNLVEGYDGPWVWSDHHRDRGRHVAWSGAHGPDTTRTVAWSGAEDLDVDLAADVRYVQAPGAGTVVLTGPAGALEHVEIHGGSIRYDHRFGHREFPKLTIVVRAPNITAFDLSGVNRLQIEGYHQDSISLDVSGDSEVTAVGEVGEINLNVSGSGAVDLGRLKAKGADVDVSGSADTTIAPTEWAKLDISGMGDVRLLTHPPRLETDISGSGRVRQEDGKSVSPAPPPTPAPPRAPVAKGAKT
ncbi:DUF2807 domain-containing protein [Phenylobacterium sp.]|uniref:GIN domain-containing protein n=1 Tax=Phenylobacterium sp. TaxID=1871053 RepID=UPI0025D95899|nr:DUF2807 domain-containing protein [Phenylobacterium sp.]